MKVSNLLLLASTCCCVSAKLRQAHQAYYEDYLNAVMSHLPQSAEPSHFVQSDGDFIIKRAAVTLMADNTANNGNTAAPTGEPPTSSTTAVPKPTVTVPSMANNPFLTQSSLPEGTVFIAVGAIISGFAVLLVTWRIIATLSLKRAADRAAREQQQDIYAADQKTPLFAGGYKTGANASSENLRSFNNASSRNPAMTAASMAGPQPGLFFSPTAEVMNSANTGGSFMGGSLSSSMSGGGVNRNSLYMPAGYYGPGITGGAASITSRSTRNFSMARESMSGGIGARTSTTGGPPRPMSEYQVQQRAPSAYLEDLLAHDES